MEPETYISNGMMRSLSPTWVPHLYGNSVVVPVDVPSVWCFQYTGVNNTSIELKCIPDSTNQTNVGTSSLPYSPSLIAPNYTHEFSMGGFRPTGSESATSYEHGNCTIHEITIYDSPMTDAGLLSVYQLLRQKWAVPVVTATVGATVNALLVLRMNEVPFLNSGSGTFTMTEPIQRYRLASKQRQRDGQRNPDPVWVQYCSVQWSQLSVHKHFDRPATARGFHDRWVVVPR